MFHSRLRKGGELVAAFVAELRRLSEHCGFGDTLPDMLRDRLVCGIEDGRIQRRLLSEPDLAFKKAFEIAQAMESAERNAQDLQTRKGEGIHIVGNDGVPNRKPRSTDNVPEIDRVDSFPSSNRVRIKHYSQGGTCNRCGRRHQSKDCNFKEFTCFRCQKQGHLARVCRSKPRRDSTPIDNRKSIHVVSGEGEEVDGDPFPEYNMYNVRDSKLALLRIHARVSGADLEMEIDTGAARSVISKATFERIWIPGNAPALKETTSRLKTYTGELIKVCGEIEVDVRLERRHALLSLIVVEGNGPSLLGRDWMERLGLSCCQLNQIQQLNELECVLAHHAKVFKDELGFVKGTQARIYIESGTSPRYFRARSLPFALRGKVEQESNQSTFLDTRFLQMDLVPMKRRFKR